MQEIRWRTLKSALVSHFTWYEHDDSKRVLLLLLFLKITLPTAQMLSWDKIYGQLWRENLFWIKNRALSLWKGKWNHFSGNALDRKRMSQILGVVINFILMLWSLLRTRRNPLLILTLFPPADVCIGYQHSCKFQSNTHRPPAYRTRVTIM